MKGLQLVFFWEKEEFNIILKLGWRTLYSLRLSRNEAAKMADSILEFELEPEGVKEGCRRTIELIEDKS